MPSTNKRINLTVSDEIYQRIQKYKQKNGCANDAGACLQMIVQFLNGQDQMEKMLDFIRSSNLDQLKALSDSGLAAMQKWETPTDGRSAD